MSLEASRHLRNARVDPRRHTHSVGMYTHVLDQWGIIYDQPLALGQLQAGAAIEGMVRRTAAENVERLAVDPRGYTDSAMAVAELFGFDLCPRLKNLRDRRLHVPRGTSTPDELEADVERDVSLGQIEQGWDELVRVVASIEGGWTSAMLALERFGAASRADPIHKSGTALGQMFRTLFLCDYFCIESFRREALRDWGLKRKRQAIELAALRADVQAGMANIDAGRVRDFDAGRIIQKGRGRLSAPESSD